MTTKISANHCRSIGKYRQELLSETQDHRSDIDICSSLRNFKKMSMYKSNFE